MKLRSVLPMRVAKYGYIVLFVISAPRMSD